MPSSKNCPFCQSSNVYLIESSQFMRSFEKITEGKGTRSIRTGTRGYYYYKNLCCDCGMIFEYMPDDSLGKLKVEMPDWV